MHKNSANSNPDTAKPRKVGKTQGLMVLGMHRSGTSAITRVLNLLGCALSDELIGPAFGNEQGHWEALSVNQLNDEMLASAGTVWNDCNPINEDWRSSAIFDEMVTRATDVLREHALQGPLFAYKDPRTCLLADVWLKASHDAGIAPLALVMIRNPAEVVGSLERRDLMKDGYAELLWLRYMLDAEFLTRGSKRTFFRYDQLLGNWRQLVGRFKEDLKIALPRNSAKVHREIEAFLNDGLRHYEIDHGAVLKDLGYSEWLRKVFAIMLRWSDEGEDTKDHATLDLIRSEFDRACSALARVVRDDEFAGEAGAGGHLKAQLAQMRDEKTQVEATLNEAHNSLEHERAATAVQETDLKQQIEAATGALEALKAETQQSHEEHKAQLEAAQRTIDALTAEKARIEAEAQSQIEAAGVAKQAVDAEIHHLRQDVEAQISEQQALSTALEDANKSLESQLQANAETDLQNESLRAEIAQRNEDLKVTRADLSAARTSAALATAAQVETEKRSKETQSSLNEEKIRTAELAGKLAMAQSTLAQREEELAQTWDKLLASEKANTAAETEAALERKRRLAEEQRATIAEARLGDQRSRFSDEIAALTQMLQVQEEKALEAEASQAHSASELARALDEQAALRATVQSQEDTLRSSEAALDAQKNAVADRFNEIARLTAILAQESEQASHARANTEWLGSVARLTESFPQWWSLLPAKWRARRQHHRLKRSGLFDAEAYLEMYPDIASFGMDPLRHYIHHGMDEQRSRPQ